ncbi:hypothetical protein ACQ9LF_07315 [Anaerohalosphaeraceae bacterium U12dextr]
MITKWIPNRHDFAAAAISRFNTVCIHGVRLLYAAAAAKLVPEAGG